MNSNIIQVFDKVNYFYTNMNNCQYYPFYNTPWNSKSPQPVENYLTHDMKQYVPELEIMYKVG